MMPITAIVPWFGAKRRLAVRIVAQLGQHGVYWEPFCGSMAVLIAKPPCAMETVNDLHGDLINLARVIQHPLHGPCLYRRLRRTLAAEELFRDSAAVVRGSEDCGPLIDPDRAYHFFLAAWMGRTGVAGTKGYTYNFCACFRNSNGDAGKRWCSAVRSIPAWRRRLEKVAILRRDAFDLLARIEDEPGTAIYVDPPYLVKGKHYVHDFADPDHARLAKLLRKFRRARIVVSYYDHPALDDLYPGWDREIIDVTRFLVAASQRRSNKAREREVLLLNGKSFGQRMLF